MQLCAAAGKKKKNQADPNPVAAFDANKDGTLDKDELATLETFRPPPRLPARGPVVLGAIVEVEDGSQGRTFFLALKSSE